MVFCALRFEFESNHLIKPLTLTIRLKVTKATIVVTKLARRNKTDVGRNIS